MRRNAKVQQELILLFAYFLKSIWKNGMMLQYILSALLCEGIGQLVAPNIEWILLRFIVFNTVWFIITCFIESENEKNFIRKAESWMKITPYEFEHECARVIRKNGFTNVRVTKGSGDGGVDILFQKDGHRYIAQCKQYKNKVTPEQVRALYGVREDFNADIVIMIAANGVTKMAEEFIANKKNYWLWTLEDLIALDKNSNI